MMRFARRLVFLTSGALLCVAADARAGTGAEIASIALANVGKGACSTNSTGGTAFDSSCTGNGGQPEYWCADFARWAWAAAGVDTSQLDAAAGSFYVYGQNNNTLHYPPSVGDAVVFDYSGGGVAEHVAIVAQVNADDSIETVSGDWGGNGSSEAAFSSTSSVVLNTPAYASTVGSVPAIMGMTISGFISPIGGPPPCTDACFAWPRVGIAGAPTGDGYWIANAAGHVYPNGNASFFGDLTGVSLAQPIVGIAATPSGQGYWMVAADGGVFTFGSAGFHGSKGGARSTSRSSAWPPPRPARATGSSRQTAGSSATGTPRSRGRPGARRSTHRWSAWPPRRAGRGTGSSGRMAGSSATGTPRSRGRPEA